MALRIEHIAAFDGPSLWHERPIVRAIVVGSLTGAEDGDRLLEVRMCVERLDRQLDRNLLVPLSLPPLPEREGVPWLLGWTAVALQRLTGDDVAFYAARDLESPGTSEVAIECQHRQTGMLALRIALRLLNTATDAGRESTTAELNESVTQRLVPVAASRRPTPELACMLAAARARSIPITSIDPRGLIRELGHGIYRRRLLNTSTSNLSFLGSTIARDKQLSSHVLAECGLPVPETLIARDAERAIAHARSIGFPVVVKPNDEGNSAGLALDLRDDDEVRAAFDEAARVSRSGTVVVQRYLDGRHYRILVVGDRIVGVAERIAAHVVGDGMHTIQELVTIENQSPRRGTLKNDRLKSIAVDHTMLRMLDRQGFVLDDVPPKGVRVDMQRIDDTERGGESIMQSGGMRPDNERIIRSAVRALELDMAGVDLVAQDIHQSIWETSGGILEVNCSTGFNLIQFPTSGEPIDPGPAAIETLFPPGAPVRVPLVAVTGGRDTTEISRLIGRLLTAAGHATGIAVQDGLYLGETRFAGIERSGVSGKQRVLLNPSVELAVLECPPDEIVEQGLVFEHCDVVVVTSLSGVAPAELSQAESVVCRTLAADGTLIVPGDDAGLVAFARSFGRTVVVLPTESGARSMAFLQAVEAVRALGIPVDTVLDVLVSSGHGSPAL